MEYINENYIIKNNDIILNIEKWDHGKNNILYITGLSGSGKTTLSKYYTKINKAEMFEIDGIEHDYDSSKSNLLQQAKEKFPEYDELTKTNISYLTVEDRIILLRKVLLYIISLMNKNKNKLYILEGIQIYEWLNPNSLKGKPMIIKGTSMTKSIIQRFKRSGIEKIDWIEELKNNFPQLFKWYINSEKTLSKFKKNIKESYILIGGNIMEYINESNYYYLKRENLGKYAYAKTDINKGVNLGLAYEKVKDTGVFIDDFDFYTPTVEIVDANNNIDLIKTKITRGNIDRDGYMFITNKKIFKDTKFTISYNDCCKYFSQYKEFEPLVESFITEAATNSSERKYKCPFCDFRDTRENLVYHIDDEHQDMIPEGYTPARVIFNYLNKKTHGTCIMCKQETDWNEKNWKYERLCNRKKCHDDYVKMMKGRMINKYGKPHLLDDEDKQKEMLNNRSISGEYKFKDGGIRTYVGSYEKATLEFYDKVLNVHSKDIMTPGPSIEYEYAGKKHIWITDIFYIPVNLVHDVKDGGNNPNTRDMKDYRKKQIAKEKAIEKLNQYNYIRLTDNNFAQLLLILAELKNMMINDDKSYITRINENGLAGISAIPSLNGSDSIHVIPYLKNNAFSGTAICKGNDMNNMYAIKNNKIENIAIDELDESKYKIYKYKKPVSKEKLQKITKDFEEGVIVEDSYFYEMLTDKKLLNLEQYEYDDDFEESIDIFEEYELIKDITEATLVHEFNQLYDRNYYVPVMNTKDNMVIKSLLKEYNNLNISQDIGGYFVYNESKNIRSKSYKTINEININLLKIMV